MKENLYIIQVRNLRKYPLGEWVNLHHIVDLNKFKNLNVMLEITLREFDHLRKEKDNIPLEFRAVKIKIYENLNIIYLKDGETILKRIKNEKNNKKDSLVKLREFCEK